MHAWVKFYGPHIESTPLAPTGLALAADPDDGGATFVLYRPDLVVAQAWSHLPHPFMAWRCMVMLAMMGSRGAGRLRNWLTNEHGIFLLY